jgi:hypothetical protein
LASTASLKFSSVASQYFFSQRKSLIELCFSINNPYSVWISDTEHQCQLHRYCRLAEHIGANKAGTPAFVWCSNVLTGHADSSADAVLESLCSFSPRDFN